MRHARGVLHRASVRVPRRYAVRRSCTTPTKICGSATSWPPREPEHGEARLAPDFGDRARDAVEREPRPRHDAVRRPAAVEQQDDRQHQDVEDRLEDLRGVAIAVGIVRKQDALRVVGMHILPSSSSLMKFTMRVARCRAAAAPRPRRRGRRTSAPGACAGTATIATITPISAPWNAIPPFQIAMKSSGCARYVAEVVVA